MLIFKEKQSLTDYLSGIQKAAKRIGYVPTMGALHKGHLSLIHESNSENDLTVCSIFVNPTQFNDKDDLEKYPRPIENDIELLLKAGCSILFLPSKEDMYPANEEQPKFEFGDKERILEGEFRNGHFQGVSQIVDKFLKIIPAYNLYIGQKDFQQCYIIKELVKKQNYPVFIHISPTIREQDGLAMSSRNTRLTSSQRANAALIYQCLISIQSKKSIQSFPIIKKECWDLMKKKGVEPDYIELADAETLELLTDFDNQKRMVVLVAVKIGDVRLIDNLLL